MRLIKNTGNDCVIDELRQALAAQTSLDLAKYFPFINHPIVLITSPSMGQWPKKARLSCGLADLLQRRVASLAVPEIRYRIGPPPQGADGLGATMFLANDPDVRTIPSGWSLRVQKKGAPNASPSAGC